MEKITEKKGEKTTRNHLLTYADVCLIAGVNKLYFYNCLNGIYRLGEDKEAVFLEAFEKAVNEAREKFKKEVHHACNNGAVNNRNYKKKYPV